MFLIEICKNKVSWNKGNQSIFIVYQTRKTISIYGLTKKKIYIYTVFF